MTPEMVSGTSKREGMEESEVQELIGGYSPSSEADTDRIVSDFGTYFGHMASGKSVPMESITVETVSTIRSKDEGEGSRFTFDPNKVTFYSGVKAVYPFGTTNIMCFRNCIIDSKLRKSKTASRTTYAHTPTLGSRCAPTCSTVMLSRRW